MTQRTTPLVSPTRKQEGTIKPRTQGITPRLVLVKMMLHDDEGKDNHRWILKPANLEGIDPLGNDKFPKLMEDFVSLMTNHFFIIYNDVIFFFIFFFLLFKVYI